MGDKCLNVSDWIVKKPATQENGMMCSFLDCKLEILKKPECVCVCMCVFMSADITFDAAASSHRFQHKQVVISS